MNRFPLHIHVMVTSNLRRKLTHFAQYLPHSLPPQLLTQSKSRASPGQIFPRPTWVYVSGRVFSPLRPITTWAVLPWRWRRSVSDRRTPHRVLPSQPLGRWGSCCCGAAGVCRATSRAWRCGASPGPSGWATPCPDPEHRTEQVHQHMHGTPDPEHTEQSSSTSAWNTKPWTHRPELEHQILNTQTRLSSSTHAWNTKPWTHRPELEHQTLNRQTRVGTPNPEQTDQSWNTKPWTHRPERVNQRMHGTPTPNTRNETSS